MKLIGQILIRSTNRQWFRLMHLRFVVFAWTEEAFGLSKAIMWFALIFAVLAVAVTLVRRYRKQRSMMGSLRDNSDEDQDDPSSLLTKFRDLHARGTLSDAEYRSIKAKLAAQIHNQHSDGN